MANGEAHRQEVGVISSGSYQNHFLFDLSTKVRSREREREKKRLRTQEKRAQGYRQHHRETKSKASTMLFFYELTHSPQKEVGIVAVMKLNDVGMRNIEHITKRVRSAAWPKTAGLQHISHC